MSGREFIRHQRAVMGLLADEFHRRVGGGPAVKFGRIQNAPFPSPSIWQCSDSSPLADSPDPLMCNLYSQTKSQDAMRHVFDAVVEEDEDFEDVNLNLPPMAGSLRSTQPRLA